jgi:HD-GYP domain-containing protein (c-di-GMP phosphodiesterase class II)
MIESRAPRGAEWADVTEVLHTLANVMTVRNHYVEGHPAIARADAAAAEGFNKVLLRVPELVLALIDGEFVVSERPLPDLRNRLPLLAEAMIRHQIECIVFQRGILAAECSQLGKALGAPASADPARARDDLQAQLTHVLLRFAALTASEGNERKDGAAEYLVPAVQEALDQVLQAIAEERVVDRVPIRKTAERIAGACHARAFTLEARAYAEGIVDFAAQATNVALLTAAMALDAGYPDVTCIDAAAAAMLHDIGRFLLPEKIRAVPQPLLAEADLAAFREHPLAGACALLGAGCPPLWVAAALEHHRGVDGGGYPALESTGAPHEIVRMIGLASFFDSRRTPVNGQSDTPEEALKRAVGLQDRYFGKDTVNLFVHALGVYAPGTTVELSDRSNAIVSRVNRADPLRPQVRVLFGERQGRNVELRDLNALEDRHLLSVTRAIPPPLALRPRRDDDPPDPQPPPPAPPPAAAPSPPPAPPERVASAPPERVASAPPERVASAPPERVASAPPAARSQRPRISSIPRNEPPEDGAPVVVRSRPPRQSAPAPIPRSDPPEQRSEETHDEILALLDKVPLVAVPMSQLSALGVDHRSAFILTFVDGSSSLETVLDACGLPRAAALRLVADLLKRGALTFR